MSNQWGVWGAVVFQTLSTPSSLKERRRWRVPTQGVIYGYPHHQMMGEDERVINLSITLHNDFIDITMMEKALLSQANHDWLLVIGSEIIGDFALRDMSKSYDDTSATGAVVVASYSLTLVEVRNGQS